MTELISDWRRGNLVGMRWMIAGLGMVAIGALIWLGRYQIVACAAGPCAYRLDRWTGRVELIRIDQSKRVRPEFDPLLPYEDVPSVPK